MCRFALVGGPGWRILGGRWHTAGGLAYNFGMTSAGRPAANPANSGNGSAGPAATAEVLWRPTPERAARAAISDFSGYLAERVGRDFADGADGYRQLWDYSTTELGEFWGAVADYFGVRWAQRPNQVLVPGGRGDHGRTEGARWFPGGRLNYAEHALTVADGRRADDVAVIVAAEPVPGQAGSGDRAISYAELTAMVAAAQAGLRRAGVQPGDRVAALLPNGIHALVAFLATAASGAVWSSCSPDFGPGSVIDRFAQIEPRVLIAVDGYRYGGKEFATTDTIAQTRAAIAGLGQTVIVDVVGQPLPDGAIGWDSFADASRAEDQIDYVARDFSDPLWVLYSSGTTGLPKPIVQSVGGILLEHLKSLRLQCDLGPGDRFFWFTTTGWMMWNFLVGGLLVGSTIVLYDGNPGYPDLMAMWRLAERHRVTYFGTSAPFISACRAKGLTPSAELDLSAMAALGSTGSPLTTDGFRWIADEIGDHVQICSVSGGTDLCTAVVGAAPTVPVWLGEISCRMLGAKVESYDEHGRPVIDQVGELVITAPMPSMPVGFWGDADGSRLHEAYFDVFAGVWRHGDWIRITERGSCVIEGRSDATLNRGGVRMGTAEFYRVVETQPGVADSLVIDTSGASGEGDLLLFVVLADGVDRAAVTAQLTSAIRSELSPRHVPNQVVAVPVIPRTLNGKKVEVPVKRILAGMDAERAVSRDALADPDGFDDFLSAARRDR